MPLRRMAIDWLGEEPVDTTIWNARVRLYPSRNSCEKNALFTPQMLDVIERGELADALDRRLAEAGGFTFVDIGANVGLYSLFVAARGGPRTRILAIEPQPGIVERLPFNLEANAGFEFTEHEGRYFQTPLHKDVTDTNVTWESIPEQLAMGAKGVS